MEPLCDCHGRPMRWLSDLRLVAGGSWACKVAERERKELLRLEVAKIKLEAGCADCGYDAHAEALDFDHRPGEQKLFSVAWGITSRSRTRILAEIAKCDVVCANCHRVRTKKRLATLC